MAFLIVVGCGLVIAGTVKVLEWAYDRGVKRSIQVLGDRLRNGDPDLQVDHHGD